MAKQGFEGIFAARGATDTGTGRRSRERGEVWGTGQITTGLSDSFCKSILEEHLGLGARDEMGK